MEYNEEEKKVYKLPKEFLTDIDFNKVIIDYNLTEYPYQEVYSVCFLLDLLFQGKLEEHYSGDNYFSIYSLMLRGILGDKGYYSKEHLFYTIFEVNNDYRFFSKDEDLKGYTKGYKLDIDFWDITWNDYYKLRKPKKFVKGKFKKHNVINIDGVIYNDKVDLMEDLKVNDRKARKYKEQYMDIFLGLNTKEIRVPSKNVKIKGNVSAKHEIVFNQESLDNLIKNLTENKLYGKLTEVPILKYLKEIAEGHITKLFYVRKGGGRLYQQSSYMSVLTTQNLPSKYRKFLFEGQFEYDINSAVVSMLLQFYYKNVNVNNTSKYLAIEDYIKNKDKYRYLLVNKCGFTYKQAKRYFSSLFFGAEVSKNLQQLSKYSSLVKELGVSNLESAYSITDIQNIVLETMELFDELEYYIKENMTKRVKNKWVFTNTRGEEIELDRWSKGKVIAYLFNGIESQVLDVVRKKYQHSLLLFDSFVSEEDIDTKDLSKLVYNETSYDLTFSKELLKGNFEEISS